MGNSQIVVISTIGRKNEAGNSGQQPPWGWVLLASLVVIIAVFVGLMG